MTAEVRLAQLNCTHPSVVLSGFESGRQGVDTDDHGWQRGFSLSSVELGAAHDVTVAPNFGYWAGYYYISRGDALSAEEHVCNFSVLIGAFVTPYYLSLRDVSGTLKWGVFRSSDDAQLGGDSAAATVGVRMRVVVKADVAGNKINVYVNGTNVLVDLALTFAALVISGSGNGNGWWSAWVFLLDATDTVTVTDYNEMRMVHGLTNGTYIDYIGGVTDWNDFAAEGEHDGDSAYQEGTDGTNKRETSTLTSHSMTGTILAVGVILVLRQDFTAKSAVHGVLTRYITTDKVLSWGSEDFGILYVQRHGLMNVPPGGGAWDNTKTAGLQVGHRRDAGTTAFSYRVTAMAAVIIARGSADVSPATPPSSLLPLYRRHYPVLHRG